MLLYMIDGRMAKGKEEKEFEQKKYKTMQLMFILVKIIQVFELQNKYCS